MNKIMNNRGFFTVVAINNIERNSFRKFRLASNGGKTSTLSVKYELIIF